MISALEVCQSFTSWTFWGTVPWANYWHLEEVWKTFKELDAKINLKLLTHTSIELFLLVHTCKTILLLSNVCILRGFNKWPRILPIHSEPFFAHADCHLRDWEEFCSRSHGHVRRVKNRHIHMFYHSSKDLSQTRTVTFFVPSRLCRDVCTF